MPDLGFCAEGERLLSVLAHAAQSVNEATKKSLGYLTAELEGQRFAVEEWDAHSKKCDRCLLTYDSRVNSE